VAWQLSKLLVKGVGFRVLEEDSWGKREDKKFLRSS
jgi:hypothetical protein